MSGSVNKALIIGHVGRDPDVRTTQDGKTIVNLSVATNESWKDRATGERRERSEWHRVAIFNDALANVAKNYVRKGSKIYVEGSLTTRKYTDKDGVERYSTEIVLQGFNSQLVLLDSKQSEPQEARTQTSQAYDADQEIPF